MEKRYTPLALVTAMVLAVTPVAATDFAGGHTDPPTGRYEVVSDDDTSAAVESLVIDFSQDAEGLTQGRIAEDGFVSCHRAGRLVVEDMTPAPDIDHLSFRATVLDAGCQEQPNTVVRFTAFSGADIWFIDVSDTRWSLFPGEGYDEPDEIVGDWRTRPDDTTLNHVTIRVEGAAPTYRGIVLDAPEGSCFTPGQVMFEFIFYGQADGPTNATDYAHVISRVANCLEVPSGAISIGEIQGAPFMRVEDQDGRNVLVFDQIAVGEPGPIRRIEDPRTYPNLEGGWYELGSGRPTVHMQWQGNPSRAFVGKTVLPDACPPAGTIVWEVTGRPTTGGTPGLEHRYEEDDLDGCVLTETIGVGFDLAGTEERRVLEVTDDRGDTVTHQQDFALTISGGTEARNVGVALMALGALADAFSRPRWAGAESGPTLYLATQANFPDGLAVAGLAGRTRGATLLVDPDDAAGNAQALAILSETFAEIVVVGGEGVVPSAALPEPGETGAPTGRLAGTNRFHTAQVLAEEGWPTGADTVYIATGANFPDALSGGAAASVEGAPVLLVDGERLPDETRQSLERLGPDEIIVLGGEAVIPPAMVTQLEAFAPVIRLAGAGRAETAAAVSAARFPGGADEVLVTSGDHFGEALIAASVAWAFEAPLLLVGDTVMPDATATEIGRLGATSSRVLAIDGRLDDAVIHALRQVFPPIE